MKAKPPIVAFLEGICTDSQGRLLSDVWAFSDTEIERTHNFFQWLFPLSDPSLSVPGSPTLTYDDITVLRISSAAKKSILGSGDWYTAFLSQRA